MQKIMFIGLASVMPLLFLLGAYLFTANIILAIVFGLLASIGLTFIAHKVTSNNPFVKAIQDGKVLIFDTPSTGVANIYCAEVLTNSMGEGIDIKMETGEVRAYDRIVTSLMSQPFLAKVFFKKNVVNPMESKIDIQLSNDQYKSAAWHWQTLTILFYNSQIGSFLTKPLMNQQEKELLAEYVSLNEARELRNLNRTFLLLMRHTFDLIADRFSRIFGNPMFQIIIVIAILAVCGYLVMQFVPNIGGVTTQAVSNIGGGLTQPLTMGGTP
jgi:hypothetical protein